MFSNSLARETKRPLAVVCNVSGRAERRFSAASLTLVFGLGLGLGLGEGVEGPHRQSSFPPNPGSLSSKRRIGVVDVGVGVGL